MAASLSTKVTLELIGDCRQIPAQRFQRRAHHRAPRPHPRTAWHHLARAPYTSFAVGHAANHGGPALRSRAVRMVTGFLKEHRVGPRKLSSVWRNGCRRDRISCDLPLEPSQFNCSSTEKGSPMTSNILLEFLEHILEAKPWPRHPTQAVSACAG